MYSYHIVAELRQFRGVPAATDRRIHRDGGPFADVPEQNPTTPA
jgi:hypothetical protein